VLSATSFLRHAAVAVVLAATVLNANPASADDEFPFGLEMTLDVAPQPGSKRIPNMEIGDSGEAILELWCKGGKGQFSVAGNTVIFVAGPLEERGCPPGRAQADDELVAALSEAASWKRQGDFVSFIGTKTLRFRLNTN
jgi:hypothetical protein